MAGLADGDEGDAPVSDDFDAIVIGAGVIGTATALALADRGRHTLVLERSQLAHKGGSSHGLNRIVRLTDFHPEYVRLNRLAMRAWEELEDAAGEQLLVRTGNLEVGPGVQTYADALTAAGERFDWLTAGDARERWPGLRFEDGEAIFVQEEGGVCFADRTVRAQARVAIERGAELREDTAAERVALTSNGVEVEADGRTLTGAGRRDRGRGVGRAVARDPRDPAAAHADARAGLLLPPGGTLTAPHRDRLLRR